jgi:hypothetical protein
MHRKNRLAAFPSPARDVTNQKSVELFNYFPPGRIWLVTSRLGTGKPLTSFLQCTVFLQCASTWGKHPKDRHICRSDRCSDRAAPRTPHSTPRCRCHSAN